MGDTSEPMKRTATIGKVRYRVDTVTMIDAHLKACPPEHRDALLDIRLATVRASEPADA